LEAQKVIFWPFLIFNKKTKFLTAYR